MAIGYISPFDIKTLLMDVLIGNAEILAFGIILIISLVSAKFGISNNNFLLILVISSIIMSAWIGQALYIIVLVMTGFIVFKSLAKVVQ